MFEDLREDQLDGAIEALLFVSDEPVNVLTLAEMLECEPVAAQDALARIGKRLADAASGIQLQEVAGGWRFSTDPAFHRLLERYILSWDTRRLSQAALETLAIIAYGQPITRLGIASIRGVNSDSPVNTLIEKGLVRESGQADAPGYPMTYSTTRSFLEKFGLRDRGDLPPLEDFAPDEDTVAALREGLSVHAHLDLIDGQGAEDSPFADGVLDAGEIADAGAPDAPVDGDPYAQAMRDALSEALAQGAGIVEKIDFSQLEFEE